jgi:hypothetical protein
MENLPANRDQLPATTNQRVIPQVDNVLMEFLAAGQDNELLEEILLQLKLFTKIVDTASTGHHVQVGLEWPERTCEAMEMYGHQFTMPPRWSAYDPERPYLHVAPTVNIRARDRYIGTDMHKLLVDIQERPGYPVLTHEVQMHYNSCSANGDGEVEIDIAIFSGADYSERFVKLLLVMFNATPEMKAKVEYVATMNVKVTTPLEDALWKVCRALASFYDWQMRTNDSFWRRDPFSQYAKEQEPEQLSYEPRLGRF